MPNWHLRSLTNPDIGPPLLLWNCFPIQGRPLTDGPYSFSLTFRVRIKKSNSDQPSWEVLSRCNLTIFVWGDDSLCRFLNYHICHMGQLPRTHVSMKIDSLVFVLPVWIPPPLPFSESWGIIGVNTPSPCRT